MKRLCILAATISVCASVLAQDGMHTRDAIEMGRALYFGPQSFQQSARVSGVSLPAANAACVNCHGALGQGSREGAQAAPDIRAQSPADAQAWVKAALQGQRRDGQAINRLMPQYALTAQEQAALTAYAALLGTPNDTPKGVSDTEILFGIYANNEHITIAASYILNGVQHSFSRANAQGGVYGRQLKVALLHTPLETQNVFALIGNLAQTDDVAALALSSTRTPSLASLTLHTRPEQNVQSARWTVPLLPSLAQQAAHLMQTLADKSAALSCSAVLIESPLELTSSTMNISRLRTAEQAHSMSLRAPLCIGVLTSSLQAEPILQALRARNAKLSYLISLAALSAPIQGFSTTEQAQILPTPLTLVQDAARKQHSVWTSLGEAAGNAVIETLARSGRVLQPELVMEKMRALTGYAPIEGAPLAWSRTQAHGWSPSLMAISNAAMETSTAPRVASQSTQSTEGVKP